jgi:hypothetical protein
MFNVALNEATLLGAEVSPERRMAAITLSVLSLPEVGPAPEDRRVQLLLSQVGRVAASLRHGRWDDENAAIEPFELEDLLPIVQRVGPSPIYGWKFLDSPDVGSFQRWSDRLSLDWYPGDEGGLSHTLLLFQEAGDAEFLDLCIWFDDLVIRRHGVEIISIEEFGAGGKRWWDGLYAGDERTQGVGIHPFKADSESTVSDIVDQIKEAGGDASPASED